MQSDCVRGPLYRATTAMAARPSRLRPERTLAAPAVTMGVEPVWVAWPPPGAVTMVVGPRVEVGKGTADGRAEA